MLPVAYSQNTAAVLRAIEHNKVQQLSNGFRIQIVNTSEYKYCTCRLSADVSSLSENSTPGIKQVVAAMTGSDLVANEVIVKTMVSHEQALDSLMMFMSEVMYGHDSRYVNFQEYKEKKVRAIRQVGETLSDAACRMSGLPVITADGLERISRGDFDQYRELCFSPERCLLTIVSNAKESDIMAMAEKYLGKASRKQQKSKAPSIAVSQRDIIFLIPDTTSSRYETVFKHFYRCEKTPKNYMLNQLAYYMIYGNYLSESVQLSCFSYDANTLHTERQNGEFAAMSNALYEPRKPGFKSEPALNEAKKKMMSEYKERMKMPDYCAELASYLVLYNFPSNYFSTLEQNVKAVTTAEAKQYIQDISDKGSSVLLIRGNERDLHCALMEQTLYRDLTISPPGKSDAEVNISKGFGAEYLISNYLNVTGLSNPPKNLTVNLSTTYAYPNGNTQHGQGRLMRKPPNLYKLENYILHDDSVPVFHYREMYDGVSGSDSTKLYGLLPDNPMRMQELRQKAAFPQEARYEDLGMKARMMCSYNDFKKGYVKVAVTEASGRNYNDYYSLSTGLRDRTDIINHLGQKVKTILYEYTQVGKYMLISKATEISTDLIITVEMGAYDLGTQLKKTEFQLMTDNKKNKK